MVEIDLAESHGEALAATEWLETQLAKMGAVAGHGVAGVAGSVDAALQAYVLPGGETIEVWSDNHTALSLRGDPALIGGLVAEYREARANV